MAPQPNTKPDLWQRAIESLSPSTLKSLESVRTGKRDVALAALRVAEDKRKLALKNQWQMTKASNEDRIVIRDALEKIISWTQRYRDAGSSGANETQRQAALPWAAIRFVLQQTKNDSTIYPDLIDDMSMVARILTIARELDKSYLQDPGDFDSDTAAAFVATYSTILEFLAAAVSLMTTPDTTHMLESPSWLAYTMSREQLLSQEAEFLRDLGPSDRAGRDRIIKEIPRLTDASLASYKLVTEKRYLNFSTWMPEARRVPSPNSTDIKVPAIVRWLFQHPSFLSWSSTSSSSTLAIQTPLSWDRTTLCSTFVDAYRDAQTATPNMAPLAYVDCSSAEFGIVPPPAGMVVRSLARQLAVPSTREFAVHSAALAVYDRKKRFHSALNLTPIEDYIEVILAVLEENPAVIVVDGLDKTSHSEEIAKALAAITAKSKNVVKLLIAALPISKSSLLHSAKFVSPIEEDIADDLLLFANEAIAETISQSKLPDGNFSPTVLERLAKGLALNSQGHFDLINLQLQRLCSDHYETDIIAALGHLPVRTAHDELEFQYDRMMKSNDRTRHVATHAFAWALHAKETLSVDAFVSALRIGTKLEDLNIEDVVDICQAFLVLDKSSATMRLACRSAEAFLQSQGALSGAEAQCILAAVCLSTCSHLQDISRDKIDPRKSIEDYAIVYLGYHCSEAQSAHGANTIVEKLKTFFIDSTGSSSTAKVWMANCKCASELLPPEHPQKRIMGLVSNPQLSPVFPICAYKLSSLLPVFPWSAGYNWHEHNDQGMTALQVACCSGNFDVVNSLQHMGAISDCDCTDFDNALHSAAFEGHGILASHLLSWCSNKPLNDKIYTAVNGACEGGMAHAAHDILEFAKPDEQRLYEDVLGAVCGAGFTLALRRVLSLPLSEHIELPSMHRLCAKVIASGNIESLGHLTWKYTLAEIMPPGGVAEAALHGRGLMTSNLLDQGYDVEEEGDLGKALRCASLCGSGNICHLLIESGAVVDDDSKYGSALHAAAMKGHIHIVRILLDAGADVNIKGGHYGNPLQAAAFHGEAEVVSLLLQAGADPHQPGFSKDVFHAAAESGHKEIIQVLLASGFALWSPVSSGRSAARMAPPPPRNLLREASPDGKERMRGWRRRYGGRHSKFDNDDSDSEDESSKDDDWVDLGNPTPRARAYRPLKQNSFDSGFESDDDQPLRRNERHESNYPLEAAAAGNHLDVVLELLAQHDFLGLDDTSLKHSLVAACRNGHEQVAKELLNRFEDDNLPLRAALSKAASHSHVSIVHMLLAHDRAAESRFDRSKATLKASILGEKHVFHDILAVARDELSQVQMKELLVECLEPATKADRSDVLNAAFLVIEPEEQQKLVDALVEASKEGKLAAVQALDKELTGRGLSRSKFSKCIRLAVENGRTDVVRYLLPLLQGRGKMRYMRNMILAAAGSGYLDILELLLSVEGFANQELTQQSLNVAAESGHESVCHYLIAKGVDPCLAVPNILWSDISVDRGLNRLDLRHNEDISSASEDELARDTTDRAVQKRPTRAPRVRRSRKATSNSEDEDLLPLHDRSRPLNAIEVCIYGFSRFEFRDEWFWIHRNSYWREETQSKQQSCLELLLQSVSSFAEAKWEEAVCGAARLCLPALLRTLLEKQANPRSRSGDKSALYYAASRECLCFPIVKALIDSGASEGMPQNEMQQVFVQALSHFPIHTGRPDSQGAMFPDTKSLKHVFRTGPGAVIECLLPHLANRDISDMKTSALLQCAAAAGLTDFFRLLVDHQVKVNELDSYYGTALQAASRFGHTDIVKILLEAGAEANIRQGRHHTALRAAVIGAKLDIVKLLLQAGLDLEASATWSYSPGDDDDPTPLQLAVQHKFSDIAGALIDAGANVHAKGKYQQCLLIQACQFGNIPLIEKLLACGIDIQTGGHIVRPWGEVRPEQITGMHAAIEAEELDVIHYLLSRGFQISADFGGSDPPLTFAARKGSGRVVELLLNADPAVSDDRLLHAIKGAFGRLGHAVLNYAVVEKLLLHRPSLLEGDNARDVLFFSCCRKDSSIVELVLEELAYRDNVQAACTAVLEKPPVNNPQNLEILLEYVPITTKFFVEACARGYNDIVKVGLEQGMLAMSCNDDGTPAIHLAVLNGHPTVVDQLIVAGANVHAIDTKYGPLLRTALETHVAKRLVDKELHEEIRSRTEMLTGSSLEPQLFYRRGYGDRPKFTYQQAQNLERIVRSLVEKGCSGDDQGPFGSILATAAFLGIRKVYDLVLETHPNSAVGGYLQNPLAAAIEGSHMDLARSIIETQSVGGEISGMAGDLLHVACENSNLPAVKLLLSQNVSPRSQNAEGHTALQVILPKLERRDFSKHHDERCHADIIANLLVDHSSTARFTDQELVYTTKIEDEKVRVPLLQKMVPRAESAYFPADGIKALIKHKHYPYWALEDVLQRLLDEKLLGEVTFDILCAVEDAETMEKLLDYEPKCQPRYRITSETIEVVEHNHGMYKRSIVNLLMRRADNLVPTEANVLTVLHNTSRGHALSAGQKEADTLETMFSRNPELKVTEEMLKSAGSSKDLEFLLKRVRREDRVVTEAVFEAFGKKYVVGQSDQILSLLLGFDENMKIPSVFVDQYISLCGMKALEQLWAYDASILITQKALNSLLRNHTYGHDGREDPHGDLLKMLEEHKGQCEFTPELQDALNDKFPEQSDQELKQKYISVLAG